MVKRRPTVAYMPATLDMLFLHMPGFSCLKPGEAREDAAEVISRIGLSLSSPWISGSSCSRGRQW